ncbi:hypothetical protein OCOJLMKI_4911 [Methylobacterium iners]|uniref:Uncharacterized protein n=2 Tax=Methylobacterium iners TaxID=418707 RepID=A0ABQ4S5B5_9HYPH|nr:hypothetical protein OCOJLMKI_4911 [Methylobacterium iners]
MNKIHDVPLPEAAPEGVRCGLGRARLGPAWLCAEDMHASQEREKMPTGRMPLSGSSLRQRYVVDLVHG